MKTLFFSIPALALTLAGAAYAADGPRGPDTNRDRVTTRAEVQAQAARLFERLDTNRDGKIDRADREARQAGRREARFDRLDADRNGQISRAEFTTHAPPRMGRGGPDGPRMGDGGMRGGPMMGLMADTNGDRAVTEAEFKAAALGRFERIDVNRDGRVTREERQSFRQKMRTNRQTRFAPGGMTPHPAN